MTGVSAPVVSDLWQCLEKFFKINDLEQQITSMIYAVYLPCVLPNSKTPNGMVFAAYKFLISIEIPKKRRVHGVCAHSR
jgi:hypothetical protein